MVKIKIRLLSFVMRGVEHSKLADRLGVHENKIAQIEQLQLSPGKRPWDLWWDGEHWYYSRRRARKIEAYINAQSVGRILTERWSK